ncbi:MAG TPA: tRNA-dihydrouridine synthase [Candidatus Nitrosocosmicus sp.]|nr:tRNA-dihydrouridine synthase [Candidatus Nitrosocosmicus sp.]
MKQQTLWQNLHKPILALSPMDGVTDAAFRYMFAKYGKPSIFFTEFTNVEGLSRGVVKLLDDFIYSPLEHPIIAQIFGTTPEDYYKVTFMACEMGFDGIDINMGCPDNDVTKRGGGAALILNPPLAKKIIRSVQQGIKDWTEGKTIESVDVHTDILHFIHAFKQKNHTTNNRKVLPVSVKTRIGYSDVVITEWVKHLLETEVDNISIHGRTLKQMYTGSANWDEIGKAAEIIKQTKTTILGNGDIKNLDEAHLKVKQYNLDGVLIGRATFGNPYFFNLDKKEMTIQERLDLCLEHSEYYVKELPNKPFIALRKHLAWYMKSFEGAVEMRTKLVQVNSLDEVRRIVEEYRNKETKTPPLAG